MTSLQGYTRERPLERIAERGVCAGLVGSAVLGLFAMVASGTYQGRGFFTPMYHAAFVLDPQTMVTSIGQAAAGERFFFVRESFFLGMVIYVLVGGTLGALFGVVARVLRLHGARALAGGVAYGLTVMVLMSLLVLPRVGAMSGAGQPIAHMGDEVGWPTFISYFMVFGLVLGVWLYLRPQDIGEPRRATSPRRGAS
jgi:hypothetical protein